MKVNRRYVWAGTALAGGLLVFLWWEEPDPQPVPKQAGNLDSQSSGTKRFQRGGENHSLVDECEGCPSSLPFVSTAHRDNLDNMTKRERLTRCLDELNTAIEFGSPNVDLSYLGGCYGQTPLHAVRTVDDAVRLLEAGADPNARDQFGQTPLHSMAGRRMDPEVMLALLEAGADPMLVDNRGETPLEVLHSTPSVGAIVYKARNFIAGLFRDETGEEIEELYRQRPNLRPENLLTGALDREAVIEQILSGGGAEKE